MQVANALNNQIRILFNPKVENFKLFDLLIVKSQEDRYLAQIIEIYDDKFDSSQDVAKLKLFYKISKDNEVIPYDNFTPNRECEIIRIKQEEIEEFVNSDKKTFSFGINPKSSAPFNFQYEFFSNKPIILADKIENANDISISLAKSLSDEKHCAIIDSSGALEFESVPRIKASKDFKIPLNYETIDFVFEKLLDDASLEFQSVAGSILNEIKKFARAQAGGFIPFTAFIRVLTQQHRATPYPELKVLILKLRKMQMDDTFATSKRDVENLKKAISNNKITIIDTSNTSVMWQRVYLDYISSALENIHLFVRLNEENCDVDLIEKIYNKTNINLIPNTSYSYKKLPTIIQYCKNYILLPSLSQRNDFLDANFALCNLISDGCIIFGENTDNFLYLLKDYEPKAQEKKKAYRKIALSLLDEEEKKELTNIDTKKDYFDTFQKETEKQKREESEKVENTTEKTDSEKLIEELNQIQESLQNEKLPDYPDNEFDVLDNKETEFEKVEDFKGETTSDEDEFQNITDYKKDLQETHVIEEIQTKEEILPQETQQIQDDKIEFTDNQTEDIQNDVEKENSKLEFAEQKEEKLSYNSEPIEEEIIDLKNIDIEKIKKPQAEQLTGMDTIDLLSDYNEDESAKYNKQEPPQDDFLINSADKIETDLSEDDLDFFEISKKSYEEIQQQELKEEEQKEQARQTEENIEENIKPMGVVDFDTDYKDDLFDEDADIDLNAVAQESIDNSFNELIESHTPQEAETVAVSDDTKINIDNMEEKENLPIFKEEQETTEQQEFKSGDVISHNKYGRGTVIKTMRYENRQLLQIEFEDAGKKLLDPKIANIKLEQ